MKYSLLGRTGTTVSKLCLGTSHFGQRMEERECHRLLDKAFEYGINIIDTANVYGGPDNQGYAETVIGDWIAKNPSKKDQIIVATKVYGKMGSNPNERGLSAFHIRAACEASLKRLQLDRIDLYQMHHIDRTVSWEELWSSLAYLQMADKIIHVGSCNFAGWHIAEAQETAKRMNLPGLVSEQSIYNLQTRFLELEVLPACARYGLSVFAWSPLNAGKLVRTNQESDQEAMQRWLALCNDLGHPPAEVALAWVLANDTITAPILGPSKVEQLDGAINALELSLNAETMELIDSIWPGFGNPAPEAYAW